VLRLDAGDRWSALETEVVRNFAEPDLSANCAAAIPLLDEYAAARLAIALRARGLLVEGGAPASREAIRTALRPVPAMAKLLSASLDVLAQRGWVETITHGFRAAGDIVSAEAELARVAKLLGRDHADKAGIVSVIDRTVPRLPEVIAGEVEPNQVIFPDGSMDLVLGYYRGHPLADAVNRQCAMTIGRLTGWLAAERDPERPVRLLEAGAGTGTTTVPVLTELDRIGLSAEYTFTDLSGVFVGRAQRALRVAHPMMRFARYDIEAPIEQSAVLGQFDIVLAANAVHATADITESLDHLAARLSPGGVLVLNEITTPQDHLTLAFGMLPGWWRAVDRRSAAGPLLTGPDWRRLLQPRFDCRLIAGPGGSANALQSLIVASLRVS
jgi:SAM-dependent methyltransferase